MSSESPQKCSGLACPRLGTRRCPKCKGADPETYYCGHECQQNDWPSHKKYCGKQAYVFKVALLGSTNPNITRKVVVPSWWTFKEFHIAIQYIFFPWKNCHLHSFEFLKRLADAPVRFDLGFRKEVLLELCHPGDVEYVSQNWFDERKVKLSDVFAQNGRHRSQVLVDGAFAPLLYEYDFGDGWEHKITFLRSELARAARPLVKEAVGCGPLEDSGGVHGWNEIKETFAAAAPTSAQEERKEWARKISGCENFDPFERPDLTQLNNEARWEYYESKYKAGESKRVPF